MQASPRVAPVSTPMLWGGRVLSALAVLFLIFDGVIKVMRLAPVIESFALLGYPDRLALGIGLLELACIAVYLTPRTSILGAILLTGYLGGAISAHVRIGSEAFSVVFPIIIGAMIWGGLYLRDTRLRTLIPLRTK